MSRIVFRGALALLCCFIILHVDAAAAKPEGRWGYMDRKGKVVIEPQFESASDFREGAAAVKKDGKWGFIDHSGKFIIPPRYVGVNDIFREGLAPVKIEDDEGQTWHGFIDKTGKLAIAPRFRWASSFSGGLARVAVDDPGRPNRPLHELKWGYIDAPGNIVIPPRFDRATDFSEGLAVVGVGVGAGEKFGVIDRIGRFVVETKFPEIRSFANGLARFKDDRENWGFIDGRGEVVIPASFASVGNFHEGMASAMVQKEGPLGYIDHSGKFVINPAYSFASDFQDGRAQVQVGGVAEHFIDVRGAIVSTVDESYYVLPLIEEQHRLRAFSEGAAIIRDRETDGEGFVGEDGRILVKPEPSRKNLGAIQEGLARFCIHCAGTPTN